MTIEELQREVEDLKLKLNEMSFSKQQQTLEYVPSGVNLGLAGVGSIDPGHEHVLPSDRRVIIYSQFESKDGWATGGVGTESIPFAPGSAAFITGASSGDDAWGVINSAFNTFIPAKKSIMQTIAKFPAITSQLVYFGVGDLVPGLGTDEQGYGFKVADGTLSAVSTNTAGGAGTQQLTTITGYTLTEFNTYRAMLENGAVSFYINGEMVAVHRTQVPNLDSAVLWSYYVKATSASSRRMDLKYMFFTQDK